MLIFNRGSNIRYAYRAAPVSIAVRLQISCPTFCRLLVERLEGARLALTLPLLDIASITQLCADFLRH